MKKVRGRMVVTIVSLFRFLLRPLLRDRVVACSLFDKRGYKEVMSRCDLLMEKHKLFLDCALTLTSLAREVGTNRTYLSRAIKISGNISFSEYVNASRINYAKALIQDSVLCYDKGTDCSGMGVEDYAIASGFSSARNFSRCFKCMVGVTPVHYKKMMVWRVPFKQLRL